MRQTTALAMEQSEDLLTKHRYLDMQISHDEIFEIQSDILASVEALVT